MPFALRVPNTEIHAAMAEADETARAQRARFGSASEVFEDLEKNTGQQARRYSEQRTLPQPFLKD